MNLSVPAAKSAISPFKVELASWDFALETASFEDLRNLRLAQFVFASTMNGQPEKGSTLEPHQLLGEIDPSGLSIGWRGCLALSAYQSIPYAVETAFDLDSVVSCPRFQFRLRPTDLSLRSQLAEIIIRRKIRGTATEVLASSAVKIRARASLHG